MNQGLKDSIAKRSATKANCTVCGKEFMELGISLHYYRAHNIVQHYEKLINIVTENPGLSLHEYDREIGWHMGETGKAAKHLVGSGVMHIVTDGARKRLFLGPDKSMKLIKTIEEKPVKSNKAKSIKANTPKAENLDVFVTENKRFTIIDGSLFEVVLRKV